MLYLKLQWAVVATSFLSSELYAILQGVFSLVSITSAPSSRQQTPIWSTCKSHLAKRNNADLIPRSRAWMELKKQSKAAQLYVRQLRAEVGLRPCWRHWVAVAPDSGAGSAQVGQHLPQTEQWKALSAPGLGSDSSKEMHCFKCALIHGVVHAKGPFLRKWSQVWWCCGAAAHGLPISCSMIMGRWGQRRRACCCPGCFECLNMLLAGRARPIAPKGTGHKQAKDASFAI